MHDQYHDKYCMSPVLDIHDIPHNARLNHDCMRCLKSWLLADNSHHLCVCLPTPTSLVNNQIHDRTQSLVHTNCYYNHLKYNHLHIHHSALHHHRLEQLNYGSPGRLPAQRPTLCTPTLARLLILKL